MDEKTIQIMQECNDMELALRELYQVIVDYKLRPAIEYTAEDIDSRDGGPANGEHDRILGVFAMVQAVLGIATKSN